MPTMQAMVADRYGPPEVLALREVPRPEPKAGEILVCVRAASVIMGDCELRSFTLPAFIWLPVRLMFGITRPRNGILGQELAGDVVAVGEGVTRFKVGDAVFGSTGFGLGAYAEHATLAANGPVAVKPDALSYEEAAALSIGGSNALHFLVGQAKVQAGERVLINGAGGSIGSAAVQLAVHLGAEVTAVDATEKLAKLTEIGAAHVIDYRKADYTQRGEVYDVIFDLVAHGSFTGALRSLTPNGRYLLGNPRFWRMMRAIWTTRTSGRQVRFAFASETADDFAELARLAEAGALRPLIDRTFDLKDLADAHRYVESGAKTGNVAVRVAGEAR